MIRPTVIAYHAIGDVRREDDPHELYVSKETFEEQMSFLARRRTVVPLEAVVTGRVPRGKPVVAITFDDGYRSVLTNAVPILQRFRLPATMFVPTRWIGIRNTWNQPYAAPLDIMDVDELIKLEGAGVVVESHGHAHINYRDSTSDEVEEDARVSFDRFTELMGRAPRYLAYPFGPSSPSSRVAVSDAGYDAAFSLEEPGFGPFAMERVWIRPAHGLRVFAIKTSGRWRASLRWSKVGRAGARLARPLLLRRAQSRGI